MILSPGLDGHFNASQSTAQSTGLAAVFAEKSDLLKGIGKGFARRALKLLVTMSTLITSEDYTKIGSLLWEHMDESEPSVVTSVRRSHFDVGIRLTVDRFASWSTNVRKKHLWIYWPISK